MIRERIFLFLINVFMPPLTVLLIAGPNTDFIINCLLFIAGVLPSHIHAFYVSCTYFHRKRRVRKGLPPVKATGTYYKAGIYSERILAGGKERVRKVRGERQQGGRGEDMSGRRHEKEYE
ncbi:hypothetical protein BJ878DRAFT_441520 [Calycina marina]|uniref:Uncharacterized protein n=1 Tax=Calycina marina TaxID=1763456 RepID=A0A9P7Z2Z5_9HELO|nr:hypothetical protein BJ878DRAFT_441520 [Calycina marina]